MGEKKKPKKNAWQTSPKAVNAIAKGQRGKAPSAMEWGANSRTPARTPAG
jgi:hypothetical protein